MLQSAGSLAQSGSPRCSDSAACPPEDRSLLACKPHAIPVIHGAKLQAEVRGCVAPCSVSTDFSEVNFEGDPASLLLQCWWRACVAAGFSSVFPEFESLS